MESGNQEGQKDYRLTPLKPTSKASAWGKQSSSFLEELSNSPAIFRDSTSGEGGLDTGQAMDRTGQASFGFLPGVQDTMEISFGSADRQKPDYGQLRSSAAPDVEEGGNQQNPKAKRLSTSKLSLGHRRESSSLEVRDSSKQAPTATAPRSRLARLSATVQGGYQDEQSEMLMMHFNEKSKGEGLLANDDELFGMQPPSAERQPRRKRLITFDTLPEEPAPRRSRLPSLLLTEQIFGSTTRRSGVGEAGNVDTKELFGESDVQSKKPASPATATKTGRQSLSLTQLLATPTAEAKDMTVEDFFRELDFSYTSADDFSRLPDPKPQPKQFKAPPEHLEGALLGVLDTLREEKINMGVDWVKKNGLELVRGQKATEDDVNRNPPDFFKDLQNASPQEVEDIRLVFNKRAAECSKRAKAEWKGQRLSLERWHLEQVRKAKAILEGKISEIKLQKAEIERQRIDKAARRKARQKQREEDEKAVEELTLKLEGLNESCKEMKDQQESAHQERMKILLLKKELLELKGKRTKLARKPTIGKEVLEEMWVMDLNESLQPFKLESVSPSQQGGKNAVLNVGRHFQIILENFPDLEYHKVPGGHSTGMLKARDASGVRLDVQKTAWALAGLQRGAQKQFYCGPPESALLNLQSKLRELHGISRFLLEVDEFDDAMTTTYYGWELQDGKIICKFGKPTLHSRLVIGIDPINYPFGRALDISVDIAYAKIEPAISKESIQKDLRNVESGYQHVSRVLEKMASIIEAL